MFYGKIKFIGELFSLHVLTTPVMTVFNGGVRRFHVYRKARSEINYYLICRRFECINKKTVRFLRTVVYETK